MPRRALFPTDLRLVLHQVQEEGDDGGVDDVGEHSTDDRDDEEGFDRVAVLPSNSLPKPPCASTNPFTELGLSMVISSTLPIPTVPFATPVLVHT